MTRKVSFLQAWEEFKELPYPDYPRTEELRDWASYLVEIDSHIAGYASQIAKGSMAAAEVPEVGGLINEVGSLIRELDIIGSRGEEEQLVERYRSYIAVLHHLISEIGALATQDRP